MNHKKMTAIGLLSILLLTVILAAIHLSSRTDIPMGSLQSEQGGTTLLIDLSTLEPGEVRGSLRNGKGEEIGGAISEVLRVTVDDDVDFLFVISCKCRNAYTGADRVKVGEIVPHYEDVARFADQLAEIACNDARTGTILLLESLYAVSGDEFVAILLIFRIAENDDLGTAALQSHIKCKRRILLFHRQSISQRRKAH